MSLIACGRELHTSDVQTRQARHALSGNAKSAGTILQSITGSAATGGGSLDMTTILSNVAGGGVGGAILMAIVGIIKNKMAKN